MIKFFRVRRYTQFPKRFESDVVVGEYGSWKKASEVSIRMNKSLFEKKLKGLYPEITQQGWYVEQINQD